MNRPPTTPVDDMHARRAEVALAARLYEHICPESAIDRAEHALGVARLVLDASKEEKE